MTQRTALAPTAAEHAPVDLETMRATVTRALALAAPPTVADLMLLLGLLRGQVELMVREVEPLAVRKPDSVQQTAARYGIGEARRKLALDMDGPVSARLALARRLARVLGALCTHYEVLSAAAATGHCPPAGPMASSAPSALSIRSSVDSRGSRTPRSISE